MNTTNEKNLIILLSLHDLSGAGTKAQVLNNISHRGYYNLSQHDLTQKANRAELVWRNDLAFVRKRLLTQGYIDDPARNLWTLTTNGYEHLLQLCRLASQSSTFHKLELNAIQRVREILAESESQTANLFQGEAFRAAIGAIPESSRQQVEADLNKIIVSSRKPLPHLVDNLDPVEQVRNVIPRDEAFRIGIQELYNCACAVCGLALRSPNGRPESHAAHIYPKSMMGSDDLRNGLCLCRLHHWAFDVGWISVSDDLTVLVHKDLPTDGDYKKLQRLRSGPLRRPQDIEMRPHPIFLREHRLIHNFIVP